MYKEFVVDNIDEIVKSIEGCEELLEKRIELSDNWLTYSKNNKNHNIMKELLRKLSHRAMKTSDNLTWYVAFYYKKTLLYLSRDYFECCLSIIENEEEYFFKYYYKKVQERISYLREKIESNHMELNKLLDMSRNDNQMLRFLGNGGAFESDTTVNSCAYFIRNNELYLIDVGENTFGSIKSLINKNGFKKVNVFITHTHADHINGLSTLCFYLYYVCKIPLVIKVPKCNEWRINWLLNINGNTKEQYNIETLSSQTIVSANDPFHFHYVKTKHVDNLDCYGLYFRYKDYKIYYSGDSYSLPEEIKNKILKNEITHYYQDISSSHYEGNVHMSEIVFEKDVKPLLSGKDTKVYFYHNFRYNPEKEIDLNNINK